MKIDLSNIVKKGETIAVAVSGGSDSMALLHYMKNNAKKYGVKVIAINVEHGIRGEASKSDSEFVKHYCHANGIELISYTFDSVKKAKTEHLTIEQAARILRYECFYNAIAENKCNKVATAHHRRDNVESVLLNLFRGTGLKGVSGIASNYADKIIRPFLTVTKEEIIKYMTENSVPYITDETNFSDDYSRNYIRLNILPKIREAFPEAEKSISRFSEIVKLEDEYLDKVAFSKVKISDDKCEISLPLDDAIFNRAAIISLKKLGIEKDWEKVHIDALNSIAKGETSKKINLPKNISAVKEYDKLIIFTEKKSKNLSFPFSIGSFEFENGTVIVKKADLKTADFKDGLYIDLDKLPENTLIRVKENGDSFTKFGGGTKKLNDFLTDKKVPLRLRDKLPVIACGKEIFAILGIAISDKAKIDNNTVNAVKLEYAVKD